MKYLLTVVVWVAGSMSTHAVFISEIMYNPSGSDTSREWVEIYNDTTDDIDLTSWKLFENGVNHSISIYAGGSKIVKSGYAVIADNPLKFLIDFPNYTGVLYDSAFSLSNTGEQLILKDATSASIDEVTYTPGIGGDDDGTTLSRISSNWVHGIATPGEENKEATSTSETISPNATSSENQGTIRRMSAPSPDIVIYIPSDRLAIAGAETTFTMSGMTRAGKTIENLTARWAFGDGGEGNGTSTKHTFSYPGRYITQVEGTNGFITGTARMITTVIAPDLSIVGAGQGRYGSYVDIRNPNKYELDVSLWKISINGARYTIPSNTIIAEQGVTRFSGAAMGFASTTITPGSKIQISFPTLEQVAEYVTPQPYIVLGSATTTEVSNELVTTVVQRVAALSNKSSVQKNATKPILAKKKALQQATSTPVEGFASSTNSAYSTSTKQKDTRLVTWFKRLFR